MNFSKFILPILLLSQSASINAQCINKNVATLTTFTALPIASIVEADGMRNGPAYADATIYYPTGTTANLKSIVLVPGFSATQSSIDPWARFFASRGYVCMTIGTNNLYDFPDVRANALIDAMETMKQENKRTASPMFGRLDTNNIGVGGWSMGGGGAQLAAVKEPRIKVVFAITPWLDTSKVKGAYLTHSAPLLILSGEGDPTAPPAQHANLHYANTPVTTNKMVFEVKGGNHSTPLDPTTGSGDLGNVAFAWMNLFLNNDNCYCTMLKADSLDQHNTSSKFLTNINCNPTAISNTITATNSMKVYPNPSSQYLNFETSNSAAISYQITNLQGQTLMSGLLQNKSQISIAELATGLYFIKTNSGILKFIKD